MPDGLPPDKIAIGFVVTNALMRMVDAATTGNTEGYNNIVNFLDNMLVQYKDDQYDKEMRVADKLGPDARPAKVFRILMKLMQRSNFVPIKYYDGELVIDMEEEEKLGDEVDEKAGRAGKK